MLRRCCLSRLLYMVESEKFHEGCFYICLIERMYYPPFHIEDRKESRKRVMICMALQLPIRILPRTVAHRQQLWRIFRCRGTLYMRRLSLFSGRSFRLNLTRRIFEMFLFLRLSCIRLHMRFWLLRRRLHLPQEHQKEFYIRLHLLSSS